MFFAPIPEKEISDFIAHGSIIRVLTVGLMMSLLLYFMGVSFGERDMVAGVEGMWLVLVL